MISPEEIVGMTDLTEDEVAAIAEHEHTDVLAAGLVEYLMHKHGGPQTINRVICEDPARRCTPTTSRSTTATGRTRRPP